MAPASIESGERTFTDAWRRGRRPTAVLTMSDATAIGVLSAARLLHLRVPDDLSVVGFDDLPISRWFSPPLTTVRQPLAEMGRTAAEMLSAMIDGREPRGRQVELATELVVRSSTAPLAQGAAVRSPHPGETRV